ncbi:beta-phosphoglucomutase [Saccharicrinis sp. FJH62]|uniref:beta-phosphoglucomutase n=1 Tax=Saccharicrinis sp. FJH62 TaxID=3344657 RepID=UPI0035D43335
MEVKACIFDLDGVICDTAKYHYLAWKELADSLGFKFTPEDNERLKGVSRMVSLDILLEIGGLAFDAQKKHQMAEEKNMRYREYIFKMNPDDILPGVLPFLDELKRSGISIALGSASKNAKTILERLGILSLFDAIVDGSMVQHAKPNPEVFLLGAELVGVQPAETVVFEDAQAGIQAALNGGMIAIGIGDKPMLQKAHYVADGFKDFTLKKLREIVVNL